MNSLPNKPTINQITLHDVITANNLQLRDPQRVAAERGREAISSSGVTYIDLATGGGKSLLAAELTGYVKPGGNLIMAASTTTQVNQLHDDAAPLLANAGAVPHDRIRRGLGRSHWVCMDRADELDIPIDPTRGLLLRDHNYLSWQDQQAVQSDDERGCSGGANGCERDGYNDNMAAIRAGGNIVVTTHAALVLTAFKATGSALAVNGESALFVDEAHNLANQLSQHLTMSSEVTVGRATKLHRRLTTTIRNHRGIPELVDMLRRAIATNGDGDWRQWPTGQAAVGILQDLNIPSGAQQPREMRGLATSVQRLLDDMIVLANPEPDSPTAVWVDSGEVKAQALIVADQAQELFAIPAAAMAVSATLTHELPRLGVDRADLVSPPPAFDLRHNRLGFTPNRIASGGHTYNWEDDPQLLVHLVAAAKGRTLVLVPAASKIPHAAKVLTDAGFRVATQPDDKGQIPALVDAFKRRDHHALIGTRSFFEGLDIPDDDLVLVVLLWWPNPNPSTPLLRATRRHLEVNQGDWWDYYNGLGNTVAAQGIGRLIRGPQDRGVVAVLDARGKTRGKFVDLMGDSPVTNHLPDAVRFLEGL